MTAVQGTISVRSECEPREGARYLKDVQKDVQKDAQDVQQDGPFAIESDSQRVALAPSATDGRGGEGDHRDGHVDAATFVCEGAASGVAVRIARRVASAVGEHRFNMWFRRSARMTYHEDRRCLEVAVPNRFVADWIGRHFQGHLIEAAREELGGAVNVSLQVDPRHFPGRPGAGRPSAGRPGEHAAASASGDWRGPAPQRPIRRRPMGGTGPLRRHLEDFIVGPSNRMAFEAGRRLAESDTPVGSPLFIHGGVGLGKTHLLQGVCERMREANPHARVLYTTAEHFTNTFVSAVRKGELDKFRRRYRQLDLLALDDVHFIANKQATQQEFLHSIDAIDLAGARVALASDSHPREIRQFSDALISRCVRGMVVEIQSPDTATRARIVEALAKRRGINLRETVVAMLAERCRGSVRELEGTLVKLHALSQLDLDRGGGIATDPKAGEDEGNGSAVGGAPMIGHVVARRLFETPGAVADRGPIRFASILERVESRSGVATTQIMGRGRRSVVVTARSVAAYLARQLTGMSYPEIANALARASHSSVVAAVQRVEDQLKADKHVELADGQSPVRLRALIDELKRDLTHT